MVKKAIRTLLLAFVAISLTVAVVDEVRGAAGDKDNAAKQDPELQPNRVTVYYFHRTKRCDACKQIEAYTDELLRNEFAENLAGGRLTWERFNVELPENEHYIADFGLKWQHLMVVRYQNDKVVEYADLPEIWDLRSDKEVFLDYVRQAVESALAAQVETR